MDFAAPGVMNFQHRENTAMGDKLLFLIDDVEQGAGWEGVNTWAAESFPVDAGQHTFIWRYQKDASGSTVSDRVWIDDIKSSGTVP